MSVLSSHPGTSVKSGYFSAVRSASAKPSVESWSVNEKTFTPLAAARSTICAGVRRPSDAVLWLWKSAFADKLRLPVQALDRGGTSRLGVQLDHHAVEHDHVGFFVNRQPRRQLRQKQMVRGFLL